MSLDLRLPNWSLPPSSTPPIAEQAPRVVLFDGGSKLGPTVKKALDGAGYDLEVLGTWSNVDETMATMAPDLVLVDVAVEGGGFELCGELRSTELGRQIPIVMLTSGALEEQLVARGLLCGADDFLCVTDRVVEFQARVRVQLRHKRDRDRLRRLRAERDNFRREAVVDALTGVPNRRATDARVEEAWSSGTPFSVVFVDVDDFKSVNDTYGHDVGDRVLKAVAQALGKSLRHGDHLGRWGGEEFVLLLSGATGPEACSLTEKHRMAIEGIRGKELGARSMITASFGVASFDPNAPDPSDESLCQRADGALYKAKRNGKNRVVLAAPLGSRNSRVSMRVSDMDLSPRAPECAALEAALLKELATGRAGLPLLPEAAAEAMRLAEDPRTDMGRIARLVERDPPLAARFVAIAGSALYSRGVKPTSTQVALVRIGLAAARDLLLQAVYERSNQEPPLFRAEVTRSFNRSVHAGVAARMLARELRLSYDYAYLCGLLHDIGEARIYRILAQMPRAVEFPEFVESLVMRHHPRAGADVARSWHLPPEIVEACANHHGSHVGAPVPVKIVIGADALIRICDQPLDTPPAPEDVALLIGIGLPEEATASLIAKVRETLTDAQGPQSPKQ